MYKPCYYIILQIGTKLWSENDRVKTHSNTGDDRV